MDKFYTNFLYLIIIRGTNFVFPYLLSTPYLARTLGEGKFGKIAFTVGFMAFFMALVEYGFNLTAVRDLTIHKDNPQKINEIYNTVFASKLVLFIISFLVALVIIFSFKFFRDDYLLYVSSLLLVLGQALLPVWFFQGINNLKPVAIINLIINIAVFGTVFLVVKKTDDYLLVNIIQGLGWILASFACMIIAKNSYNLDFCITKWKVIWSSLRASFGIFLTNFLHFSFLSANLLMVGLFVEGKALDEYSYSDKIYMMLRTFAGIIYVVVYPKVNSLFLSSPEKINSFLLKISVLIGISFFSCSSFVFIFASEILLLLSGQNTANAILLLRTIAFAPFLYAMSVPISQKMLISNYEKELSVILCFTILFNLCINLILLPLHHELGGAISLLLTEAFFLTLGGLGLVFLNKKSQRIVLK